MGSAYGGNKAAVTYTGPGDIVSGATAWYGLRAYNAAYAAAKGKSVNLRRASDNTTCDFDINTSGNLGGTDSGCGTGTGLSLAAFATQDATCTGTIASTTLTCASASSTPHAGSTLTGGGLTQPSYIVSCGTFTGGAGTCTLNAAQTVSVGETITMTYGLYVTEAYDQSGANHCSSAPCNVTQATAGSQPQLFPTCINSNPCMGGNGSEFLNYGTTVTNQPLTIASVAERSSGTNAGIIFGGQQGPYFNLSANAVNQYYGSTPSATSATDKVPHSLIFVANGASSAIYVDNTSTSDNPGAGNFPGSAQAGLFSENAGTSVLTGYIAEAGMWGSAFNSTQAGNMCHNQYTYWGTNTSC